MLRKLWSVSIVSSLLICALVSPPTARGISSTVVISEFRTRGPNGANDEFIELYNLSSSPVDMTGWQVKGSNGTGTVTVRANINSGAVLGPGCHYLLANSNTNGYSGSASPNQTYSVGITDDGGIAITTQGGTIIDQVGMSSGSAFKEGATLSQLLNNVNQSYERRPGSGAGNGQDTDDNHADFRLVTSNPQNASSACITNPGTPSAPTGTGAAEPSTVNRGGSVLLTVTVSPGQNPASTGLSVTGNLSLIGGGVAQPFYNDGTHGDVTPNDSIFSYRADVPDSTSQGEKGLAITVADAQGRSSSTAISVTVQEQSGGSQCGTERWAVKTGTDADVGLVDQSAILPTTIGLLRGLTRPASLADDRRAAPVETTVYTLTATLTLYKLEEDSDYHLVLRDEANNTIIAELDCPCCVGVTSPFASRIMAARNQFDSRFTATTSFQTASIPVRVVGVGFFDFPHGQTGAAPNQIELHPLLDIQFDVNLHKPEIVNVTVDGKRLLVSGVNFDDGAKVYIGEEKQKTANDETAPTTQLVSKKAGKNIARGQTVTLTVRNSDGTQSDGFSYTKP